MRIKGRTSRALLLAAFALSAATAPAQTQTDMARVLERLDRLEAQNRALLDEIRELRNELTAAREPALQERLEVQESRTAELAATKVEASQRFPLRVTGMALFNTYFNSNGGSNSQYPAFAPAAREASGGASVRQTVIGLDYNGPQAFGGGKISGSLRMDLFGGSGQTLDQLVRLRTATLSIDWADRGFLAGVDKPVISPRDPESLAQVGSSPLSGAGNLWLWLPQARFQQDFRFGGQSGVRAQVGVIQTHEDGAYGYSSAGYAEPGRPGVEARVELFAGADRRFEAAGGIHHSVSHVMGASVPSDVYSADWFVRPWHAIEFTGAAYTGWNVATLGTGGIRQGFVAIAPGRVLPVRSRGGWAQLTYRPAARLWFNLFSGQQDDRDSGLPAGGIGKNLALGANVFCRLAPNVLASVEASQTRTNYIGSGTLLNNHYDLALGYLF
ncbi:MAG: hypothetical protein ACM336_09080 [Acidobacteriota bacterium]